MRLRTKFSKHIRGAEDASSARVQIAMLEQYLQKLNEELQLDPLPPKDEHSKYHLALNPKTSLSFKELDPGFFLTGLIAGCPKEKREDLFILLSRANFLGQGTGGSCISLDNDEKFLTLSLYLPYDMNYKAFKETVEDFVNYIDYWREELIRLEQTSKSILE